MTTIDVQIPRSLWLTANGRLHWREEAKRTKELRRIGAWSARASRATYDSQVRIIAWIGYATTGRADPANAAPTVKALVDGLVDAGLMPDDSHEWVIGPDYRRDPIKAPRGFHTVRLEIEEVA